MASSNDYNSKLSLHENSKSKKGCNVETRSIIWYVVFVGFVMNYMVRTNINIALVSMVQARRKNTTDGETLAECLSLDIANTTDMNVTQNITNILVDPETGDKFSWDEHQQNLVLGAFFWVYWATQLPGGMLAQRYGTKIVFGLSNFIPCLLACLIPYAAYLDIKALIFLRFLQGTINGPSWPSMHCLAASWVPPNERSRFMSAYMGSSIGIALTYAISGELISRFGWPSVFYMTAVLGTLWYICWLFLVYDTPAQHPRISQSELQYINKHLGVSNKKKSFKAPWKYILLSCPVWVTILSQIGNVWALFTLMTQSPTYFKYIHGWSIRKNGLVSGLPHLCRYAFSHISSMGSDFLLRKKLMSRTGVRKLAMAFCCIGQGAFVLGIAFSGCNQVFAAFCLLAATAFSGSVAAGALSSFIDLSPNFASVLLGLNNMFAAIPGFVSPMIVGVLTYNNQTIGQWQLVFIITAAVAIVPGVIHVFFAKSDLQKWNSPTNTLDLIPKNLKDNETEKPLMMEVRDDSKKEENSDKIVIESSEDHGDSNVANDSTDDNTINVDKTD